MIPDYQSLMLPVLTRTAAGEVAFRELVSDLARDLRLSEDEIAQTIPSGRSRLFDNRVGWATSYLRQAGLIERPRRGYVCISSRGRELLARSPSRIDNSTLNAFPEFRQFRERSRPDSPAEQSESPGEGPVVLPSVTPDERIDIAAKELDAELRSDLLRVITSSRPEFFEKLVVELLLAMGYGGSRSDAGERLGRTGDGGVDGVIREDRLGLDLIYLQAKRYAPANRVGVDAVRSFAGALNDNGAQKGILLTTSGFSTDATAYAKRQQTKRIIIIDGDLLTSLMVRFGIGVRPVRTIEIKRLDQDYFDDEETS